MSDLERRFHEDWLGMVKPVEGLVVSVPVLIDAQCMNRLEPAVQHRFLELCPQIGAVAEGTGAGRPKRGTGRLAPEAGRRAIRDLGAFLSDILGLTADLFDAGEALPEDLSLYVPEGGQTIKPTLGLRRQGDTPAPEGGDATSAREQAGSKYVALVWDLGATPEGVGLDLDRAETVTGPWRYPPGAKFDRLLRNVRVPIGLLTNRRVVRLVYAPHGESSGSITFRVDDMASVGGRPILDAFVMLLSRTRFFGVTAEHQLPALLAQSRERQATVTNELAQQVFEALEILLAGFGAAAERDGDELLRDALSRDDDHLYGGLLAVLLRLVFVLYSEDRDLLPVENSFYAENLSVLGLFERLQQDSGRFPDSMSRRFGAWGQLVTLFRAVFHGVEHGSLVLPARRGELFDPHRFPFLEGWGPGGSAPIDRPEEQAAVHVPTIDDGTVFRVLEKLIVFQGQRLSYDTLDVEQIGSVYEALMGHHVRSLTAAGVCLRPDRVWVTAQEVLDQPKNQRGKWLQEEANLAKGPSEKLAQQINALEDGDEEGVLAALEAHRFKNTERVAAGRLVVQPGAERRRTSSHYTPRSLSAPIVKRTLEPLLAAMGPAPKASEILELKVCDPAMGSGAFLVEACRFLADQLVAAWQREGHYDRIAKQHEDVVHFARRLVAQRCLYGVDKNPFAVNLAKLSLWLVTLAKDLPFTFLDHALRHGDSLVGLSLDQIRAFDWKPSDQLELFAQEIEASLHQALDLRHWILKLAEDPSPQAQKDKEHFLWQAEDALKRVRLIADLCVGAFFAKEKDKDRRAEREKLLVQVATWLAKDDEPPAELLALQAELRDRVPAFHWMIEFPEVFYDERPDPLDGGRVNKKAWMDAFVGNPPFAGKNQITEANGPSYLDWLMTVHAGAHGNADYSAHFFRRTAALLGNHGTIGLLATKTIGQGDTRTTALLPLVRDDGFAIYEAIRSRPWPGEAAVAVAVVHLAHGTPVLSESCRTLDGVRVEAINSRLRGKPERPDPKVLESNVDLSFQGSIVLGMGFTLTQEERDALISKDKRNGERIFPYIGGEEINTSPTQDFDRYVVHFGTMDLEEAERWPDLIGIVRQKVKPERDVLKDNTDGRRRKAYWWQFGRDTPALYSAIRPLRRCLVTSRVTKHLCFSFQPTNRIFSERIVAFPFEGYGPFAVLQSRVHAFWVRLLSSTLEDRLNYAPSDCFENFAFPTRDPRGVPSALEVAGERLYTARARFMAETEQGLTKTYNRLSDRECMDHAVVALRALHEELDRAVLSAYRECARWPVISVPPYGVPVTPEDERKLEAFEDEVIDRLFQLNEERAAAERPAVACPRARRAAKKPTAKKDEGPSLYE